MEKLTFNDAVFLLHVKKLLPYAPTKCNAFLVDCKSCNCKQPARTLCGYCDWCVRQIAKENNIELEE
jgi:hypothetical protein